VIDRVRVHLDTDIGGDPDDACALAMLLGWPGVDVVGVTTAIDPGGRRAGCAAHVLRLAGREDVPLAAGAAVSLTTGLRADPFSDDERFWPRTAAPRPSSPGAALDLLDRSIAAGATIAATGPCTNLALLELARPGSLARTPVVLMGSWVFPPAEGLPAWGPDMDWNVQWDTRSARVVVARASSLTLAKLPATLRAHLREADLPRLRAAGPLGDLLARQSLAHAEEAGMRALARAHAGLPNDLLNFQYDPVACAVAVGWRGAQVGLERAVGHQVGPGGGGPCVVAHAGHAARDAPLRASLALPAPPLPVSVRSRVVVSSLLISASSRRRPTKLVRSAGRLPALDLAALPAIWAQPTRDGLRPRRSPVTVGRAPSKGPARRAGRRR
jgi:purine nucleosidase